MRKKWSLSHQELRPIISNLKYNYQPEKGNKNLLHIQFRQQSMKVVNQSKQVEKLCKSEQRELDAVRLTLSVMYMPLGDLIE